MDGAIDIARWILGGCALAFGGFIAIGNFLTLIGIIVTKGSSSFILIIGGLLAGIGLLILPIEGIWRWAWIPLVADFGCVPVWIFALLSRFFTKPDPPNSTNNEQ